MRRQISVKSPPLVLLIAISCMLTGCRPSYVGSTAAGSDFASRTSRVALRELVVQQGHENNGSQIEAAAFSRDGAVVVTAGGQDFNAVLWDCATGRQVRSFEGHNYFIRSVSMSADGGRVLTSSDDGTVRLWDSRTGAELSRHKDATVCAAT